MTSETPTLATCVALEASRSRMFLFVYARLFTLYSALIRALGGSHQGCSAHMSSPGGLFDDERSSFTMMPGFLHERATW